MYINTHVLFSAIILISYVENVAKYTAVETF